MKYAVWNRSKRHFARAEKQNHYFSLFLILFFSKIELLSGVWCLVLNANAPLSPGTKTIPLMPSILHQNLTLLNSVSPPRPRPCTVVSHFLPRREPHLPTPSPCFYGDWCGMQKRRGESRLKINLIQISPPPPVVFSVSSPDAGGGGGRARCRSAFWFVEPWVVVTLEKGQAWTLSQRRCLCFSAPPCIIISLEESQAQNMWTYGSTPSTSDEIICCTRVLQCHISLY